ncbi:MAG TPA: ABC-F family ATP-binding cassette domain-containing protein [Candidatus Saccharimonadales bacterium]|nr:ABC-F family ATP-binding cassette domain-containing protein [Candidatus Saccharimonadales bacterium]
MLTARGVRKSYGAREVLSGIDWAVPLGSRWGLVGPNGSGKTTLVEILAGAQSPGDGAVDRPGRTSIAWLPQEGGVLPEGSLLEAVLSPFTEVAEMEARIHAIEAALSSGAGDRDASLRELGDLQHRFEAAGGFRLESEAKIILGGLGFAPGDHSRPITEFSGGYRTRALLGSLLLQRPDYLLMDEPTNHLDLEGIQWLESYLSGLPSAVVVVSHDRVFLNRTVDSIAELDRGRLTVYRGNYDAYRREKAARRERASAAAAREEKRTAQVEKFIERFRYKASKARQVQDRIRMLDRQERTAVPEGEIGWGFRLSVPSRPPGVVLEMKGISKSWGAEPVFRDVDLALLRGERVALVGPNGCGKSTLLRIAAGDLASDSGEVRLGDKAVLRYVAQHLLDTLSPGRTILEEMQSLTPSALQGDLRSLLGLFQFSGDDVFKDVSALSGGEKSRVALARLALQPGHLLLLDEPTNHLDLAAREALEESLAGYEGSVLFASHDRYFINRVAHRVAGFRDGGLVVVTGGYDEWAAAAAGTETTPLDEPERQVARQIRKEERRAVAEARNVRNRRLRGLREAVEEIEKEIAERERRVEEIRVRLADGGTYGQAGLAESLGREEKTLAAELEDLFERWEAASRDLSRAERDPDL